MSKRPEENLVIYQRRMPHWRLPGSWYFVTWRLAPSQVELTNDERGVIMEALKYFAGSRYELYACVVMHDHVHLLIKPLIKSRVQDLVHSWKSFTAHKLRRDYGRKTPIWQEEYFDRIIRDEKEFLDKAQYIINNPLKRWPDEEEYPWVWIKEQILHRAGVSPADNDESGRGGHGGPPYRVTVTTKENAHIGVNFLCGS